MPGSAELGLFAQRSPDSQLLGNKALFAGEDATFRYGLWVTDGTSAGTHELTLAQAYSDGYFGAGIYFPDLTVLGGKVLSEGKRPFRASQFCG